MKKTSLKNKGWKKIRSKIIHKNPWYYLRKDDVIRPDGNKGKYFYIDGIDSASVIAENKDKKIYLVGQTRYVIKNKFSWENINGGIKKNKKPLQVAKEELREEIGMIANEWTKIGFFYPNNGYASEKAILFLAQDLKFIGTKHEPTEDIEIRKEKLNTILKMIKNNQITCGITIASINKYLLYKAKKIHIIHNS